MFLTYVDNGHDDLVDILIPCCCTCIKEIENQTIIIHIKFLVNKRAIVASSIG